MDADSQRRRRSDAGKDAEVLASPDQGDLFGGAPTAPAYVPKPEHIRNRLQALVADMEASTVWPWEPAMVALHRERTFAYLCGLLPDRDEAEAWRRRIEAETARLDAAA